MAKKSINAQAKVCLSLFFGTYRNYAADDSRFDKSTYFACFFLAHSYGSSSPIKSIRVVGAGPT